MRTELRYALLAAMETCWVYSIVAFVGEQTQTPTVSPLALGATYWVALLVGRTLPRLRQRWSVLQVATIGIALLVLLVVVRLHIVGDRAGWLDLTWLPNYFLGLLSLHEALAGEFLATLSVLYMFIRGLGFGQRPLTLWFIGFQFRIGILAFFALLVASAIGGATSGGSTTGASAAGASASAGYGATAWILIYFFVALVSVALARMNEVGNHVPLGPRWFVTLVGAALVVVLLALVFTQFLTLDAANAFLVLLAPIFSVIGVVLYILLIPLGLVAAWFVNLLEPYLLQLRNSLQALQYLVPAEVTQEANRAVQTNPIWNYFGSALKPLSIAILALGVGLLIAKALNRRLQAVEAEEYRRESIGASEDEGRVREPSRPRKTTRRRAGPLAAETIRRVYAALVARASETGLPRRAAETPNEFLPRLQGAWPANAEDIQAITQAYVAVHYGEHDATKEEVKSVRSAWERVRRKT